MACSSRTLQHTHKTILIMVNGLNNYDSLNYRLMTAVLGSVNLASFGHVIETRKNMLQPSTES